MGTRLIVTTFVVFSWSCEKYNGRRLNPLEATVFAESSCSAIVCLIQSSTTGYTAANSSGVIAETLMAGEKADAVAIPSHKPIAIVLDFMNPCRSRWRLWGGRWQAGVGSLFNTGQARCVSEPTRLGGQAPVPCPRSLRFGTRDEFFQYFANEKLCRLTSN